MQAPHNAPVDYSDPTLRPVRHFEGCRNAPAPQDRLAAVRKAARSFREEMLSLAPARFYRSVDLVRVPYPTRYALRDACTASTPFIHILMVMEKEIAGPSPDNPNFPNFVPSSELTPYWLFPRIKPAVVRGPLTFGTAERSPA